MRDRFDQKWLAVFTVASKSSGFTGLLTKMVRIGDWRAEQQPILSKKYGRPSISRSGSGHEALSRASR